MERSINVFNIDSAHQIELVDTDDDGDITLASTWTTSLYQEMVDDRTARPTPQGCRFHFRFFASLHGKDFSHFKNLARSNERQRPIGREYLFSLPLSSMELCLTIRLFYV